MPIMQIPDYWNAKEALAVYEFLDDLKELIGNRYGPQLQELMQAEQCTEAEDIDDEIDF